MATIYCFTSTGNSLYTANAIADKINGNLPEYEAKDSEALRAKIESQIHNTASAIMNRVDNQKPTFSLLNKLIYLAIPGENSDQYFSVTSTCKGCATCKKVCPADNIVIKAGRPVYQHRCEHCLACLHNCPVSAIDRKDKTLGKARYRNKNVTLDELIAFNTEG